MGLFSPGAGIIAGLIAGKPDVPEFQRINPQEEQLTAIRGNTAALPQIQDLASGVNLFNQQQIDQMLQRSIPLYDQIRRQGSEVSSQMLANDAAMARGEIPKDVQDQIQNNAAAKALGGGFAGSSSHGNLVARDLGLTSLNLQQMAGKGLNAAESWLRSIDALYQPGMFNVSSMFLTPQQQIAVQTGERNAQFQHDWTENMIDWQTSAGYLAGAELNQTSAQMDQLGMSIAGKAAGMAMGNAMGGGGGGY